MGRRKSYEADGVVEKALPVFWESGFEATSLAALEAATGVNKFGLYETFGSKRGLYLSCLAWYSDHLLVPYFQTLDPRPEGIQRFLNGILDRLASAGPMGCFLLNGAVEAHGADQELVQRLESAYGILSDRTAAAWGNVERGKAFAGFVQSLMLASRTGADRESLVSLVEGSRPLWDVKTSA